ncbi:UBC-like protein [Glarea lozoyensis ATCC 20868]|uniref:E2 ubiquitin-conjugating enzyme n=1 Tax=Glarea lozoyensis (strain ATCC 20868 / MF5171) TaxID=1116229 RepID=S3DXP4_GLAL2|nr:UBC-like protein [Glarea lozoyensis ATCC 20868]EPE36696.1 UBC-like protein [Glarea lozoyensis ATCC 20868]
MASSQKRITKELAEVLGNPPEGIAVNLVDEGNVHNWNIVMDGPEGSPYEGGKFKLLLVLPTDYPFKPPKISFKTRIWHPNVTFDEHGSMCIGILKPEAWKPSSKIMSVLTATQNLLAEPVPDDAVETSAAEKFKNDRPLFNREAREYTRKYAK